MVCKNEVHINKQSPFGKLKELALKSRPENSRLRSCMPSLAQKFGALNLITMEEVESLNQLIWV